MHSSSGMNSAALLRSSKPIYAFWCRIPSRPNFGDALTPWLIRRICGRSPRYLSPNDPKSKYFVTGSIMGYTGSNCIVWGAGIMNRNDIISPQARILAVRGPLTFKRAEECGAECADTFGDPALLLPRIYRPRAEKKQGVGIIPHFSDLPRFADAWRSSKEFRLIDIQAPVEAVIDQINRCEWIASSSLHGIIASHAYGIKAVWLKFRDLPSGDGSKFLDYYLSADVPNSSPIVSDYDRIDLDALAPHAFLPTELPDAEQLWQSCPF